VHTYINTCDVHECGRGGVMTCGSFDSSVDCLYVELYRGFVRIHI